MCSLSSFHIVRLLCIPLLFSASCLLTTVSGSEIDDVQQRIEQTVQQLRTLEQDIAISETARTELQSSVDQALSGAGERKQRLKKLDADIGRFSAQLETLDSRLDLAKTEIEQQKRSLSHSLIHMQSLQPHSELKILLQHEDPALSQRLRIYSDYFLKAQMELIDVQTDYLLTVAESRERAFKDRNWLNHIRKKAERQRQDYELTASEQTTRLLQATQTLEDKHRSVSELRADQERLQNVMEELRAAQLHQSGYFESGKGRYPPPVHGKLKAKFGDIKSVGKLRWEGWFIQADNASSVQTIADGEIVYADWLEGFGMLVIVDHGDGFMSLYGGNRSISATLGNWVESGATIATVGDSGGQNTSGLYFEIRQDATALDPKHWISADVNL